MSRVIAVVMTKNISEVRFGERGNFFHQPNSKSWKVTDLLLVLVVVTVWGFFFFLMWVLCSDND